MANRLHATLKRLGLVNGVLYWTDRLLAMISAGHVRVHRYRFFVQPVPDKPLLPQRATNKTRIVELKRGDSALADLPRPAPVIDARFEQGGICIAAYVNEVFAGCLWYNPGGYREDEVRCLYVPLPTGAAVWDYDVYVVPQFRVGRVFFALWDAAFARMRNAGVAWSLSRVSAYNAVSESSHRRLGARPSGGASFVRLGALQLMVSGKAPHVHVSMSDRRTPSISLLAAAQTPSD